MYDDSSESIEDAGVEKDEWDYWNFEAPAGIKVGLDTDVGSSV